MKKYALAFIRRGLAACGLGPVILALVYLIQQRSGIVQTLSVNEVCAGIFSLTALAFLAGGMNVLYQIERLPLMVAILLHGTVLYLGYLGTYLINGWLERGRIPLLVFTGIFVVGYLAIWAVIYSVTRRNTEKLNAILQENRQEK